MPHSTSEDTQSNATEQPSNGSGWTIQTGGTGYIGPGYGILGPTGRTAGSQQSSQANGGPSTRTNGTNSQQSGNGTTNESGNGTTNGTH